MTKHTRLARNSLHVSKYNRPLRTPWAQWRGLNNLSFFGLKRGGEKVNCGVSWPHLVKQML